MQSLAGNTPLAAYLADFTAWEGNITVFRHLVEGVLAFADNARKVIQVELKKSKTVMQISTLNTLIDSFISSKFHFYSFVIAGVENNGVPIRIPNFTQREDWSAHQAWLQYLVFSLVSSNQFLVFEENAEAKSYIEAYRVFEKTLLDTNKGSLKHWPALVALEHLRQKQTGLYPEARGHYEDYYSLGQQLYLMNLLRSSLYYFEQLVVSHGEHMLKRGEVRVLINQVLKQMDALIASINALSDKLLQWGKAHHRELLLRGEHLPWVANFDKVKDIPNAETTRLVECLKTFEIELNQCPIATVSGPLPFFNRFRIMKTVEVVNAQLNPQSKPIFLPVAPPEDAPVNDVPQPIQPIQPQEPPFIQAVRSWIKVFYDHAQQKQFLDLWREICYLDKSFRPFIANFQLPATRRHALETKQAYLVFLKKCLESPEQAQINWASTYIRSLPPLPSQELGLTATACIKRHIDYNERQLEQHAGNRFTLSESTLDERARHLIELLPPEHEVMRSIALNYIKVFHNCCFPSGFSYSEQKNLNAEIPVDNALKQGLNTLLREVMEKWKEDLGKPGGQLAYCQVIAEGLMRLGANPLAWLEANDALLQSEIKQESYGHLFVFLTTQTKVFLSFIQYHAAYLGQTFTRLETKWEPFINAVDKFSDRLRECIQSDRDQWQISKAAIDFIWGPEKRFGARQERFKVWLASIRWVYQLLNQVIIDVNIIPGLRVLPTLDVRSYTHQLLSTMDDYMKRIPSKITRFNPFNEGYKSFHMLKEAWIEVESVVLAIANERQGYLNSLQDRAVVVQALQIADDALNKVTAANNQTAVAHNRINLKDRAMACGMLTMGLSAVREGGNSPNSQDGLKEAVLDAIYTNLQWGFLLRELTDSGWVKETFMEVLEELLAKEKEEKQELAKGKEEVDESPEEACILKKKPSNRSGSSGLQFFDKGGIQLPGGVALLSESSPNTANPS